MFSPYHIGVVLCTMQGAWLMQLPLQMQGPEMYRTVRSSVMHAVMSGALAGGEGEKLMQGYKRFLQSYTYLT